MSRSTTNRSQNLLQSRTGSETMTRRRADTSSQIRSGSLGEASRRIVTLATTRSCTSIRSVYAGFIISQRGRCSMLMPTGYADYAATGYAGIGAGLNNPAMQNVDSTGPLLQGGYTIQAQQDNVTAGGRGHGLPASMRLTPNPGNQMYGRAGFLIHGPHANDHHDSSNGCPILAKSVRDKIGDSDDNCLQVRP